MEISAHGRKPLWEQGLIPGQAAVGQSIRDSPAAVDCDVAVSKVCQAGVDQGFRVEFHGFFAWIAVVLVVGVPSEWMLVFQLVA